MSFKTISVIGLGYIGLPTAAIIASRGIDVIGVDVNQHAVDLINQGKVHIVEPDLDIIVRSAVQTGNLRATVTPEPADAFMIAVPTPFKDDHQPDLSYIEAAAKAIAPVLEKGNLVVLESTSPVGSTEKLAGWLADARPDLIFPLNGAASTDVNVAYCPERVLPGYVLQELISNDRVVGGLSSECAQKAIALYEIFVKGDCLITNARTAEMAKLTENSFRDVNIAFANELSIICDTLQINVWELIKLSNRHPRVNILKPGPGVGGHCIAVDPWFIVSSDPNNAKIIRTAREVNDGKPHYVVDKVIKAADRFKDPVIACLGLSFKADIDDLRESPAMGIVDILAKKEVGKILVVEPNIGELPDKLEGRVTKVDLSNALKEADITVLLVDHKEFRNISLEKLHGCMTIDTRGVLGG
ncbi:UDP-N-acetyl-D-mannosamine dehydrogenase [hydrothermal vent metagenome]|uniref:UDP-N-acetyl-D-mannosamine dehydrogenase n=1 Tax=hydrothermal vent metagenome TaxID=652676 RepID=A0A3B0ZRK5_9ZZZZ